MRLTWYGHAAFGIDFRDDSGSDSGSAAGVQKRIILDPYNYPDCGGYARIDEAASVVCVSHENRKYHSDVSAVNGNPKLLRALEITGSSRRVEGIRFEAHEVFEDDKQDGPNAMVKFTVEGLTIAHQGDLGHRLGGEALDFLRDVDVLLALAGGAPTIALPDLVDLIRETRPALVFPMHYKTPKVNLSIQPVEHFLALCGEFEIERPGNSSYEIAPDSLPGRTRIVVLEHAR